MKKITFFYMNGCPYCAAADKYLSELKAEGAYSDIEFEKIEENVHADIAAEYDYYFVPALFCGKQKLFEGAPTKETLREALKNAV